MFALVGLIKLNARFNIARLIARLNARLNIARLIARLKVGLLFEEGPKDKRQERVFQTSFGYKVSTHVILGPAISISENNNVDWALPA